MAIIKKVKIVKSKTVDEKKMIYKCSNSGASYSDPSSLANRIIEDTDRFSDGDEAGVIIDGQYMRFYGSTLPHCCGISEFGDLSVSEKIDVLKAAKFLDEITAQMKGKTIIINTIHVGAPKRFADILEKTKSFVLVKTFKNRNGGNTIKTWISNND